MRMPVSPLRCCCCASESHFDLDLKACQSDIRTLRKTQRLDAWMTHWPWLRGTQLSMCLTLVFTIGDQSQLAYFPTENICSTNLSLVTTCGDAQPPGSNMLIQHGSWTNVSLRGWIGSNNHSSVWATQSLSKAVIVPSGEDSRHAG